MVATAIPSPVPECDIHLHDADDFNLLVAVAIMDLRKYPGIPFPDGRPWITAVHAYPTREHRWKAFHATEEDALQSAVGCGLITSTQANLSRLHLRIADGDVFIDVNYLREPESTLAKFESYLGEPMAWDFKPVELASVQETAKVN